MSDTLSMEAVVIGGSAGALQVLRLLLPAFSAQSPPVVIVVHLPNSPPSLLPQAMKRYCTVPIKNAEDKELLAPGTVYFASPGYHLLIETDRSFGLSVDPPVHYSRPSVDVLFESAAYVYGPALAGILLTGASEDGAYGCQCIVEAGGTLIVQTAETALCSTMPASALARCTPQYQLEPEEMPAVLQQIKMATHGAAKPHG